ncbi:YceI family protein [Chryseobacterium elymi]|uniref:YceI family protein n=1 Tax=Chryseobacterium elymi TaxID=395936 RepID=A0A3D9DK91_9FLAO|nr:YceI family protein [Chryseobacterium elymi]REC78450.1 YceI family protein [Chryseobacterium elymi]
MTKFMIQPESSTVNWTGKKILGLHTGTINIQSGYLSFENDILTGGEIVIDMTSIIITDIKDPKVNKDFLDHLNHDDFFSTDQFKTAKLSIIHAEKSDGKHTISGHLTIKDITNPISFIISVEIFTDFLHALGEIVIDRTMYNMKYGSGKFLSNLGDQLIHDDFVLQFKLIGQK